jgi:hypothetical protein
MSCLANAPTCKYRDSWGFFFSKICELRANQRNSGFRIGCRKVDKLRTSKLKHSRNPGVLSTILRPKGSQYQSPMTLLHHSYINCSFAWGLSPNCAVSICSWFLENQISVKKINRLDFPGSLQMTFSSSYPCNCVGWWMFRAY